MKPVEELYRINSFLAVWQEYDPQVKVTCASTAIRAAEGWILIDPIPLAESALLELTGGERPQAVVLTSGNHQRASLDFRARYGAMIHAPAAAQSEVEADVWWEPGALVADALKSIPLSGAALGEAALLLAETLILGDALVHLDGLQVLPAKYCENEPALRQALPGLLTLDFKIVCFAHGLPIVQRAKERVMSTLRESAA